MSWVSLSLRLCDFAHNALRCGSWRQPAATIATPPFASRQRGGERVFALKSLASAQPARPRQQRSLREPKPVLSAGRLKILAVGGDVRGQWLFAGGKEPRFQDSRAPAWRQ